MDFLSSLSTVEETHIRTSHALFLSPSLSFSFSLFLSLSMTIEFFQIPRLSIFELNVKQSDCSVIYQTHFKVLPECGTERVNKITVPISYY